MIYVPDNDFCWSDNYKKLIHSQLNITGLHILGHAKITNAVPPMPPHYHHTMEFVVILKGRQTYTINNRPHTLHGGDIFMTSPDEVHGDDTHPQEICEFIWFQFDLSSHENFLDLKSPYSNYLFQQLKNYNCRIAHTTQKNLHILYHAFQLLCSDDIHNHLAGYSYFLEFVINNLCTSKTTLASSKNDYDSVISNAIDYVHMHIMENPTLEDIAKHCGLSPAKLNTKFKEQVGVSPHAYITMLKIDTAKILLKNPEMSITDVALQLNFSSSNHFSSVFKKYTGQTPTSFRLSTH